MDRDRNRRTAIVALLLLALFLSIRAPNVSGGGWRLGIEVASVRLMIEHDPVRVRTPLSEIGRSVTAVVTGG